MRRDRNLMIQFAVHYPNIKSILTTYYLLFGFTVVQVYSTKLISKLVLYLKIFSQKILIWKLNNF